MSSTQGLLSLDIALGGPLGASFLNSMLYMLEIVQAYDVLSDLPSKQVYTMWLVITLVFIDTVGTVGVSADIYLDCVTLWGNPNAFLGNHWPYPLVIATTAVTGVIVHMYLLRRLYSLHKHFLVLLPIALIILAAFIGAVLTTVVLIRFPSFLDTGKWDPFVRMWNICSAVADILLAGALVWRLRQVKSPFKATQTLLRRLSVMAIETGALTAVLFIVTVILLLTPNNDPIAVALELITGRAYTNTLLYNLRLRRTINGGSSVRATEDARAVSLGGIQVTRTHQEHREDDNANSDVEGLEDKAGTVRFDYPPSSPIKVAHAV